MAGPPRLFWYAKLNACCHHNASCPGTNLYYPRSMEHLPPPVRSKAIEIANALLEEGYEEGKAIRIAMAKAKEWAERRGLL